MQQCTLNHVALTEPMNSKFISSCSSCGQNNITRITHINTIFLVLVGASYVGLHFLTKIIIVAQLSLNISSSNSSKLRRTSLPLYLYSLKFNEWLSGLQTFQTCSRANRQNVMSKYHRN